MTPMQSEHSNENVVKGQDRQAFRDWVVNSLPNLPLQGYSHSSAGLRAASPRRTPLR